MKETTGTVSSNKLSKLNLLRNLSKINKANQEHSPEIMKDEIYNKGVTNTLKTANFMKSRDEGTLKKYKLLNSSPRDNNGFRSFIKLKSNMVKELNQNQRLNEFFKLYEKERPKSTSKLNSHHKLNDQVLLNNKSNNQSSNNSKLI